MFNEQGSIFSFPPVVSFFFPFFFPGEPAPINHHTLPITKKAVDVANSTAGLTSHRSNPSPTDPNTVLLVLEIPSRPPIHPSNNPPTHPSYIPVASNRKGEVLHLSLSCHQKKTAYLPEKNPHHPSLNPKPLRRRYKRLPNPFPPLLPPPQPPNFPPSKPLRPLRRAPPLRLRLRSEKAVGIMAAAADEGGGVVPSLNRLETVVVVVAAGMVGTLL